MKIILAAHYFEIFKFHCQEKLKKKKHYGIQEEFAIPLGV